MSDKKMGRPTENPRSHKISARITNESMQTLTEYCIQKSVNTTTAIEHGIAKLKDELQK